MKKGSLIQTNKRTTNYYYVHCFDTKSKYFKINEIIVFIEYVKGNHRVLSNFYHENPFEPSSNAIQMLGVLNGIYIVVPYLNTTSIDVFEKTVIYEP